MVYFVIIKRIKSIKLEYSEVRSNIFIIRKLHIDIEWADKLLNIRLDID